MHGSGTAPNEPSTPMSGSVVWGPGSLKYQVPLVLVARSHATEGDRGTGRDVLQGGDAGKIDDRFPGCRHWL